MNALGRHFLVELWEARNLDKPDVGEEALIETVRATGGTLLDMRVIPFPNGGYSGVCIIAESHVTIHTWPEYGYAAVDMFTCGPHMNFDAGVEILRRYFEPGHLELQEEPRGVVADRAGRPPELIPGGASANRSFVSDYKELVAPGLAHCYTGAHLASDKSAFQAIDIYDNPSFGRLLMLDGRVQTTERDEFIYHEMLVHVPLLLVPSPRRVLVIGGGDGGTLRRVLEHPSVEHAVMVEIDERVTQVCREWLPSIAGDAFEDARAQVLFVDGIAYVRDGTGQFDAIIIDSSDPVGPSEGLFTEAFYRDAARRLCPGGVVAAQAGSPYFQRGELQRAYAAMRAVFPVVRTHTANVPTYPGSLWSFLVAGEGPLTLDPSEAAARATERGLVTRYWTPELQRGAFDLPRVVLEALGEGEPLKPWGSTPGQE